MNQTKKKMRLHAVIMNPSEERTTRPTLPQHISTRRAQRGDPVVLMDQDPHLGLLLHLTEGTVVVAAVHLLVMMIAEDKTTLAAKTRKN